MDTVDTLPMAILSGQYNQKSTYGTPMSDVMDIYNKRQPNIDVANARQAVADKNIQGRTDKNQSAYDTKVSGEDKLLEDQIIALDKQISDLDEQIASTEKETTNLTNIMNNRGTSETVAPTGEAL
jgi:uncharacterized protein involved in exopolysaccharide biosynthesis